MLDSENQPKQLSVLIVAFNDTKKLERCVDSVCKKLSPLDSWEIIIINNDKRLEIKDLSFDFSRIKLIDHKKNVGFGRAINMGEKRASGENLLILNPDAKIVSNNALDALKELSKNEVGILGGGIIGEEEVSQDWSAGKEVSLYDLARNNLGLTRSKDIWNSEEKTSCDWVSGTGMFIKKDFFGQLGGFDEDFFMYFEDMDLCRKARKAGKKVVFFPNFKIYHSNGGSYDNKKLQKKHYYDSMEKYFQKNKNKPSYWMVKTVRRLFI